MLTKVWRARVNGDELPDLFAQVDGRLWALASNGFGEFDSCLAVDAEVAPPLLLADFNNDDITDITDIITVAEDADGNSLDSTMLWRSW